MRRIRFTIAGLLVLILFVAVGFAGLREANEWWDSGLLSATLGILLISSLLAAHRRESQRAFWLGFALFGSSYLGLSLVPPIESRLITTKALAYLDSKWSGTTENFVRIGHSLLALCAGFLGGRLSRILHARNQEGTPGLASWS